MKRVQWAGKKPSTCPVFKATLYRGGGGGLIHSYCVLSPLINVGKCIFDHVFQLFLEIIVDTTPCPNPMSAVSATAESGDHVPTGKVKIA